MRYEIVHEDKEILEKNLKSLKHRIDLDGFVPLTTYNALFNIKDRKLDRFYGFMTLRQAKIVPDGKGKFTYSGFPELVQICDITY